MVFSVKTYHPRKLILALPTDRNFVSSLAVEEIKHVQQIIEVCELGKGFANHRDNQENQRKNI